jgi:hypothetical protein
MQLIHATTCGEFLPNEHRRFHIADQHMNRQQRRAAARQRRQGTRPGRAPTVRADVDTLDLAMRRAGRLTAAERCTVLDPTRAAFKALREGVATFEQWAYVSSAVTVAQAIEDQGVVRGFRAHLDAAERAIDAVFQRVNEAQGGPSWGRATTLYFQEIEALDEALHWHDWQLQHLSGAEFHAVVRVAERHIRAAGGQAIEHRPITTPQPTQENLL